MSHVRVELPNQVGHLNSLVEIDELDITRDIKGFKLSAHADQDVSHLELALNLPTASVDAQAQVTLAPATVQLLTSLGWTPPGPAQEHRQAVAEEIARNLEQYIGFRDASKAAAVAREVGARVPKWPTR